MANVVYCSSNDLFNNNYYSALATPNSCNPTHLPSPHTGIADSGASSFYFLSSAPVSNLNPEAPTICVRVANGLPVKSVASATLASVPSLPPAAMQGHVMPSFSHTLIGLGAFADLGHTITFTKTGVFVVDPAGQCVLKGWREKDGPRLWHFPLTAAKPSLPAPAAHGMHGATAADLSPPTPATPINAVAPSPSVPPPGSSRVLPAAPSHNSLHPSQGIHAIGPRGEACSVLYLYGAAQAMALAASTSNTTFDPCSMQHGSPQH
jgi:hypothetical protein